MWKALENTFAEKSIGSQNLLRKQLNRMKLEEEKSMGAHLLAFEDLIRQLETAGAKIVGADAVVSQFQTFPDSYDEEIMPRCSARRLESLRWIKNVSIH